MHARSLYRTNRRPHGTTGIPAARILSTVLTEQRIAWASSWRVSSSSGTGLIWRVVSRGSVTAYCPPKVVWALSR